LLLAACASGHFVPGENNAVIGSLTVPKRVLNSLQNREADRCVDIFMREDGTFGFEEYRRDHEDGKGWFPLHRYSHQIFDTAERALACAQATVEWMIAPR
jgi:hypothetical protein